MVWAWAWARASVAWDQSSGDWDRAVREEGAAALGDLVSAAYDPGLAAWDQALACSASSFGVPLPFHSGSSLHLHRTRLIPLVAVVVEVAAIQETARDRGLDLVLVPVVGLAGALDQAWDRDLTGRPGD
jgi:hypothetical protein